MEYRNAKMLRNGMIDCEIDHPDFGWIPTTLASDDNGTKDLHAKILSEINLPEYEESLEELELEKNLKIASLNSMADFYIQTKINASYPEFEKQTFEAQRREATAWAAEETQETPMIDILAANREIPRTVLISKILEKVSQFETLAFTVAGKRQKIEDQIKATTNLAELEAIEINFN